MEERAPKKSSKSHIHTYTHACNFLKMMIHIESVYQFEILFFDIFFCLLSPEMCVYV